MKMLVIGIQHVEGVSKANKPYSLTFFKYGLSMPEGGAFGNRTEEGAGFETYPRSNNGRMEGILEVDPKLLPRFFKEQFPFFAEVKTEKVQNDYGRLVDRIVEYKRDMADLKTVANG